MTADAGMGFLEPISKRGSWAKRLFGAKFYLPPVDSQEIVTFQGLPPIHDRQTVGGGDVGQCEDVEVEAIFRQFVRVLLIVLGA